MNNVGVFLEWQKQPHFNSCSHSLSHIFTSVQAMVPGQVSPVLAASTKTITVP